MTQHERALDRLWRRAFRITQLLPSANVAKEVLAFRNITRKMEMLGLNTAVVEILAKTHDRFFFRAHVGIKHRLSELLALDVMSEGHQSGGPHDMIFDLLRSTTLSRREGRPDLIHRKSYREHARPSLQIVIGRGSDGDYYGDADIDLASPVSDVIGFITHMFEVLTPGATNHLNLKKGIDRDYESWKRESGRFV